MAPLMQKHHVAGWSKPFAIVMPELHKALVPRRGWMRYVPAPRQIHSVGSELIGVRTDLRGSGLHAQLIEAVVNGARRAGYDRVDGSVIDERNKSMCAVVRNAGMKLHRRYRFYRDDLTPPG